MSAPARPTVGEASVSASRNAAAYSRAVRFLPRMCQYSHRSPHSCRPSLASRRVGVPCRSQQRVERGLEVALLGDSAFERSDLIGALDAVADRRVRAPRTGGRAAARPRVSHLQPRAARARTRRSSAASGACPADPPPGRELCRRATRARRGRSRRGRCRRSRRPRMCTLRRRRPCAGTGAAPTHRGASGSSRSWRAASAAARECRAGPT